MSGLLGLLWWDIRGSRKEMINFKTELNDLLKREYLTKEEHEKLCIIDTLETEKCFRKALSEHRKELIAELKTH